MPASRDDIRHAIRRVLAARAADAAARDTLKTAQEASNAAQVALNLATGDLGRIAGTSAFAIDGKLVSIVMPFQAGVLAQPTVTVSPLTDLDVLDVPLTPSVAAPTLTPVVIEPVPVKTKANAGTVPELKKGK